ncbi:anti-sigma factor [Caballeronia sp. LZ062]|uniref:anti-sigma factor family protein n=1 Tax=unclassified Caballeronia TaxID=2646786 RepID=UPI00285B3E98|nr:MULTISPECIES: anti-sigma factor [unclassified Caballeronia]MDR5857442.1 anti-sigma factor [Caballeronia sp. LZ050]MDR5868993.1 anti-sigma factor [Caballeronia sp. LZ062]
MDDNDTASLETRLTDGSLNHRAPVHLRAQVLARVREEAAREHRREAQSHIARNTWRSPFSVPWPFFGGAFAGATLSAIVLGAVLWVQTAARMPPDSPIAQEIVSSHVRALMSDRPIDVLSSDKHTVKPWFNGRIDYAPPVIDPAGPGFALVGGRLDYIGHRPVAVVVYRYLKHPIDVYVFPDKPSAVAQKAAKAIVTRSDDGYALARWNEDGMTFWAVTDASGAVLNQFIQAIEAGAPR